ncbi:MAG: CBS domain-containing protein [Bacteroidetes bacterium]|nr:CBS domain-containing protein [Bacteroidota bacterium]
MAEKVKYPSITEYMTTHLITVSPQTDIKDAIYVLLDNKISGAPVVNGTGDMVGILSEKDCLRLFINQDYHGTPGGLGVVEDFMTKDVKTLSTSQTVVDAAYAFINSNFRRFPVLDNGKLVGQVSRRDVLGAVKDITILQGKVVPSSWVGREPS